MRRLIESSPQLEEVFDFHRGGSQGWERLRTLPPASSVVQAPLPHHCQHTVTEDGQIP